jgi:hypothetical protein
MGFYSPILYPVPLRRGGLGADVSAYNGIVYIAGGAAGQVTPGIGINFDTSTGILTGRLRVQRNGSTVGDRPILNLIEGDGVSLNVLEDIPNNRINVEVSSTCCGEGQIANGQLIRPLVSPSPNPDGVEDEFLVPDVPTAGSEHAYLNGYLQLPGIDYTLSGNVFTFTTPPDGAPDADILLVDFWSGTPAESSQRRVLETPTGLVNSVNTVYTTVVPIHSNTERVWKGPLLQIQGTDYTVTDVDEITFTVAPTTGDDIRITYWEDGALDPANTVHRDAYAGAINSTNGTDGNNTLTLAQTPVASTVHVYRNGQLDTPGVNYDVFAGTVVFQPGYNPITGDTVEIFYDTEVSFSATILSNRVMYETPSGLVNGANVTYILANDALLGYAEFYVEGEQLHYTAEFTQGGAGNRTLTLAVAPLTGNRVWANYWRA